MNSSDLSFTMRPSRAFLDDISTYWPQIEDPVKFVLRYGPAIQRYIRAIVREPQEAEDACQDFLVKFFEKGMQSTSVTRGRFRDYLKAAARNAALTQLRRRSSSSATSNATEALEQLATADSSLQEADELWTKQWRTSLMERVWKLLEEYERREPESLYHTVLRFVANQPTADSATLALLVSQKIGRTYRPDAFRKQVSRARRVFAQLIVDEVRQTLSTPTADAIEEELADLNLLKYVRDFLPTNWRETGRLED